MRAKDLARSEQPNTLLNAAKNQLATMLAVCQRQHLLFSLIENAAGPEADLNQSLLLAQIGMEITNEARLSIEATLELIAGGNRHAR